MKKSKQPARAAGGDVGQAHQGVPPSAARIFSNYVLRPARRHPDEAAPAAALQGAALLVFADQPGEQIKLGQGDNAQVRVDPSLRAREDVGDQFVSGHANQPSAKERSTTMATELHCSACDALLDPGSQHCPRCGMQLMAIAQPAVYAYVPRFSLWNTLLVLVAALGVFAWIADSVSHNRAETHAAALDAALAHGELNTAQAFEARCGLPRWTSETTNGTELHYLTGADDLFVTLAKDGPVIQREQTDYAGNRPRVFRINLAPAQALRRLGCK